MEEISETLGLDFSSTGKPKEILKVGRMLFERDYS